MGRLSAASEKIYLSLGIAMRERVEHITLAELKDLFYRSRFNEVLKTLGDIEESGLREIFPEPCRCGNLSVGRSKSFAPNWSTSRTSSFATQAGYGYQNQLRHARKVRHLSWKHIRSVEYREEGEFACFTTAVGS